MTTEPVKPTVPKLLVKPPVAPLIAGGNLNHRPLREDLQTQVPPIQSRHHEGTGDMRESSDAGMVLEAPQEQIHPGVRVQVRPSGELGDLFAGQPGWVTWAGHIEGCGTVVRVSFDAPHLRHAVCASHEVDLIE